MKKPGIGQSNYRSAQKQAFHTKDEDIFLAGFRDSNGFYRTNQPTTSYVQLKFKGQKLEQPYCRQWWARCCFLNCKRDGLSQKKDGYNDTTFVYCEQHSHFAFVRRLMDIQGLTGMALEHNFQAKEKGEAVLKHDAVFINPMHNLKHWQWLPAQVRDENNRYHSFHKFLLPVPKPHSLVHYLAHLLAPNNQLPKVENVDHRISLASQICYFVSVNKQRLEEGDIYQLIALIFLLLCFLPTEQEEKWEHSALFQRLFFDASMKPKRCLIFNPVLWLRNNENPVCSCSGGCVLCCVVVLTKGTKNEVILTEDFLSKVEVSCKKNKFAHVWVFGVYALSAKDAFHFTSTTMSRVGGSCVYAGSTHQPYYGGVGLGWSRGIGDSHGLTPTFPPKWWLPGRRREKQKKAESAELSRGDYPDYKATADFFEQVPRPNLSAISEWQSQNRMAISESFPTLGIPPEMWDDDAHLGTPWDPSPYAQSFPYHKIYH